MLIDLDQNQPRTYIARGSPKMELALTLGGGILFAIVLVVMLALLFNAPATGSSGRQPGFIGGFSVIPIMLIARGLFVMRNFTRVTLDQNGIAIESPLSFKIIPWNQIDRIQKKERGSFMGETHDTLILLGANGKPLAEIRDTLDRFPDLIQQIESRSTAARGAPITEIPADDPAEMKKNRRRGKILASLFALFTFGMIAGTIASFNELTHEKKFATEAIRTDAKILKHYMVRQTPWLEFEFTDPAGHTIQRQAMMEMGPWEALTHSKTVPLEYLRSDPSWNRLARGEDHTSFSNFWPLGLIGILMFGTCGVFSFLGYDLKTKGGAFQVTRWGEPLDD
jgi:hypothetical protein